MHDVRGHSFCFNYHMLPYASNLVAALEEQIVIVVLWRSLGDMIVSNDDHHRGPEGANAARFFVLDINRYRNASADQRFAFLINSLVPWYLDFYLAWRACDVVLHPYERLVAARRAYFYDIIAGLLGTPPNGEFLDATLETKPGTASRFNVGIVGRSAEKFSAGVKRRLEQMILDHPDREQLEILLWELPWKVPFLESDRRLDGKVVSVGDDPTPYFISRGRAHAIVRPSWLASRTGERRTPQPVDAAEFKAYELGDPLV